MIEQLQKEINATKLLYENVIENQNDLYYLIIIVLVVLFVTIISSSIIGYIKGKQSEKGKIRARQDSLESILEEQKNITKTVENIKNDIEKGIWLKKEKNSIKRQKLDEMLILSSKIIDYFTFRLDAIGQDDKKLNERENPLSRLLDLNILYFYDEDIKEISELNKFQIEISELEADFRSKRVKYFNKYQKILPVDSEFIDKYSEIIHKYILKVNKIRSILGKQMTILLNSH
jgi:hypothetical protein